MGQSSSMSQPSMQVEVSDITKQVAHELAGPCMRERKREMRAANSRKRAITPPPRVSGGAYGSKLWRGAAARELAGVKAPCDASCRGADDEDGLRSWENGLSPWE